MYALTMRTLSSYNLSEFPAEYICPHTFPVPCTAFVSSMFHLLPTALTLYLSSTLPWQFKYHYLK